MKMFLVMPAAFCLAWLPGCFVCAAELVLVEPLHHLRIDGPREWSEFAETPSADHLEVKFEARPNDSPQTLRIRQQDVKQSWRVLLNGKQLGPHWVTADRITLFANGRPIREEQIRNVVGDRLPTGVLWADDWTLPKPRHDVHLVAIASGPGIDGLYWKTAKPYQPDSPDWQPRVIGCSGTVWLDGDGRRTAAYDYARRMVKKTGGDLSQLIQELVSFDAAAAAQAAHMLQTGGTSLLSDEFPRLLSSAAPPTKAGVQNYLTAWCENQMSRSER